MRYRMPAEKMTLIDAHYFLISDKVNLAIGGEGELERALARFAVFRESSNGGSRFLAMRLRCISLLEQQARSEGMRTMFEDGLVKSLHGQTTIEEVLRVTSSEN